MGVPVPVPGRGTVYEGTGTGMAKFTRGLPLSHLTHVAQCIIALNLYRTNTIVIAGAMKKQRVEFVRSRDVCGFGRKTHVFVLTKSM